MTHDSITHCLLWCSSLTPTELIPARRTRAGRHSWMFSSVSSTSVLTLFFYETVSCLKDNLLSTCNFILPGILIRGQNDYIMLCCAVPNPKFRNVARLKPAFQVSTYTDQYGSHPASLANDGSRQTNYAVTENGCAASEPETNPWWAVDLLSPTIVYFVNLTNGTYMYIDMLFLKFLWIVSILIHILIWFLNVDCCTTVVIIFYVSWFWWQLMLVSKDVGDHMTSATSHVVLGLVPSSLVVLERL